MNNFSSIIQLIWVADESLVHHLSSTSERRHNQYAWWLVDLASDELLGYEVHSVSQRCDQGDRSITVEGCQFILSDASINVPGRYLIQLLNGCLEFGFDDLL